MKKFPLIQYNKGSFTFTLSSPNTDPFMFNIESQLVTAAIKIMSDIEKKAERERIRLEIKRYWLWDDKNKLWCSFEDYSAEGFLGVLLTDAIDPEKNSPQFVNEAVVGSYGIDKGQSYSEAVREFQKECIKHYKDNPHAFYLRYWRIKFPGGSKPVFSRADRQVRFNGELEELNEINWKSPDASCYDGPRLKVIDDEVTPYYIDISQDENIREFVELYEKTMEDLYSMVGISVARMGSAVGQSFTTRITKDNYTKK